MVGSVLSFVCYDRAGQSNQQSSSGTSCCADNYSHGRIFVTETSAAILFYLSLLFSSHILSCKLNSSVFWFSNSFFLLPPAASIIALVEGPGSFVGSKPCSEKSLFICLVCAFMGLAVISGS